MSKKGPRAGDTYRAAKRAAGRGTAAKVLRADRLPGETRREADKRHAVNFAAGMKRMDDAITTRRAAADGTLKVLADKKEPRDG